MTKRPQGPPPAGEASPQSAHPGRWRRRFRHMAGGRGGRGGRSGHGAGQGLTTDAISPGPTLNDVGVGGWCRVEALLSIGPIRRRLLDLGLVPGTPVQVLRSAPLLDPLEIRIGDTFLTLRRREAQGVAVSDLPAGLAAAPPTGSTEVLHA